MIINPQKHLPFDDWLQLFNCLCSFAYEAGAEACRDGLPRTIILEMNLLEPMCYIAWEAGYDDEKEKA